MVVQKESADTNASFGTTRRQLWAGLHGVVNLDAVIVLPYANDESIDIL